MNVPATSSTISLEPVILALEIRNLSSKFSYGDRNEMLYGLGATSVHNHVCHNDQKNLAKRLKSFYFLLLSLVTSLIIQ